MSSNLFLRQIFYILNVLTYLSSQLFVGFVFGLVALISLIALIVPVALFFLKSATEMVPRSVLVAADNAFRAASKYGRNMVKRAAVAHGIEIVPSRSTSYSTLPQSPSSSSSSLSNPPPSFAEETSQTQAKDHMSSSAISSVEKALNFRSHHPLVSRAVDRGGFLNSTRPLSPEAARFYSGTSNAKGFGSFSARKNAPQLNFDTEEEISDSVKYYVNRYGYKFEQHHFETEDGYKLVIHRIYKREYYRDPLAPPTTTNPKADSKPNFCHTFEPVILQHGLFMSSGIFVTGGKTSLAFQLADHGYDVWMGNNRAVSIPEVLKFQDAKFWDWCLDDLAKYDFPCFISNVLALTKKEKVYYVGFSQGTAQAFIGLSLQPDLSDKIRMFVALSPAVFISKFPTSPLLLLSNSSDRVYYKILGEGHFIPWMHVAQKMIPPNLYSVLSYAMFHFLFKWSDELWDKSRVPHYYQFAPSPVSTKLIRHWAQISVKGRLAQYDGPIYTYENIRCPIVIIHGTKDNLATFPGLVEELERNSNKPLLYATSIEEYAHLDVIWANNVVEKVYDPVLTLMRQVDP